MAAPIVPPTVSLSKAEEVLALTYGKCYILCDNDKFEQVDMLMKNLGKCPTGDCNANDIFMIEKCECYDVCFKTGNINYMRNFYNPPKDSNRVTIKPSIKNVDGYVSASFISFDRPKEYIACSAPLRTEKEYFWQMVHEQKSPVIVMILDPKEPEKCVYYPLTKGAVVSLGEYRVKCVRYVSNDSYEHRQIVISKKSSIWQKTGTEKHLVHHFFYKKWPDMDVPSNWADLYSFYKLVKEHGFGAESEQSLLSYGPSYASVVHCMAGIGRTGTFIILDYLIKGIEQNLERTYCIEEAIMNLRRQRMGSVQKNLQYRFIYAFFYTYLIKQHPSLENYKTIIAAEAKEWLKKSAGFQLEGFLNPTLWNGWKNRFAAIAEYAPPDANINEDNNNSASVDEQSK